MRGLDWRFGVLIGVGRLSDLFSILSLSMYFLNKLKRDEPMLENI